MAAYESNYPGRLILPGGKEIAQGDIVDLTKSELSNAAVKGWVDAGYLVAAPNSKKASS